MPTKPTIDVLVVDDSAMVRKILARELAKDPRIAVVGTAADAFIAREMISQLRPDVLLLDIEMPQMDGLTFLAHVMENCPMPVIIVSSLAREGGRIALQALELGAAEVIAKPGPAYSVKDMGEQLIEKVKAVAEIKRHSRFLAAPGGPLVRGPAKPPSVKMIAVGAATGGPEAVAFILSRLPPGLPPILVVQHMPPHFLTAFAERLNEICALEVKVAEQNEELAPGRALIAPGNMHLAVQRGGRGLLAVVKDGPLVHHQRPSIEVLFRSAAMYAGPDAVGVILTGKGADGPRGLLDMKNAGAFTIAQDEASCAVYGLPKEAMALGAVSKVAPLEDIPEILVEHL